MINWQAVDTVLLDLDGTLLDLHFDNHFWLQHLPRRYADRFGMDIAAAKAELYSRYRAVEGRLVWYCLDHWERELNLNIVELKREVEHLIAVRPNAIAFLDALRGAAKRVVLATNAHPDSLTLKFERTRLQGHFDAIYTAHDLRHPKEHKPFWQVLQTQEPFDPRRTLFIDDNESVLASARDFGIRYLLGVRHPDSRGPEKRLSDFRVIKDFAELLPIPAAKG
jgi:putative hydrolase of the HAD superfamily